MAVTTLPRAGRWDVRVRIRTRWRRAGFATVVAAALASTMAGTFPARGAAAKVVVRTAPGATLAVAFERLGATVTQDLPIVDGFAATVPLDVLPALARLPGVRAITPDRPVRPLHANSEPVNAASTSTVRVDDVWAAGLDGRGVTIAVLDTGVSSVPDLEGRLVPVVDDVTGAPAPCANFSGDDGCEDGYGHGTFVAGVAAASGTTSQGRWRGVAPEARILSVKLAGADGAADVSTLLAAIQWTVSHRARYGIRVMNLSVGSDSSQSYLVDPLNYAVEKAWQAGIVVVAAAGNRGPHPATIIKPADDPWVITVGAIDDGGTADGSDDMLPAFTGRGPTLSDALEKPDLVAPGAHVVSLRAPGSAIDAAFPAAVDRWHRRGSGTSFAAPAVAGTVALMLQHDPTLTPDRVKHALAATARETAASDRFAVGAGILDAFGAVFEAPPGVANQHLARSDGTGAIDRSRATLLMSTDGPAPQTISGPLTQQLQIFDGVAYRTLDWTGANWHGSQWAGANWHGANWHGANWHGANWHGANWHGVEEDDASYGEPYLGSALYGAWE